MSKIYIDGSGFNGKESRYCIVCENAEPVVIHSNEYRTNNEMEYEALVHALKIAKNNDHIITDAKLLVGQVTMGWKVKAKHLEIYVNESKRLVKDKNIKLYWTPREKNKAGHVFEK